MQKTEQIQIPSQSALKRAGDALRTGKSHPDYAAAIDLFQKLTAAAVAAGRVISPKATDAEYQLMVLDPAAGTLSLTPFVKGQEQIAERAYSSLEGDQDARGLLVVLVSVSNLKQLRKAYPNYFLDTKLFVETLRKICGKL